MSLKKKYFIIKVAQISLYKRKSAIFVDFETYGGICPYYGGTLSAIRKPERIVRLAAAICHMTQI